MKIELETPSLLSSTVNSHLAGTNGAEKTPAEIEKILNSAIKLAKDGDSSAARQLFLYVTEADEKSETAWLWLASISEYPEELMVFLQNVLNLNPQNARAIEWMKATKAMLSKTFVQRGIKASHENQREFAVQCFRQAIEHDEQNEMGWLWLAYVADSPEEKVSYLQKVLVINPASETARTTLKSLENQKAQELLQKATSAAISGDRAGAREMLRGILEDFPETEEGWILQAYLADGFYEKISSYRKVLAINPENEAAQAGLTSLETMQKANESKSQSSKTDAGAPRSESATAEPQAESFSAHHEPENLPVETVPDDDSSASFSETDAEESSATAEDFDTPTQELAADVLNEAEKSFVPESEAAGDETAAFESLNAEEVFVSAEPGAIFAEVQESENPPEEKDFAGLIGFKEADSVEFSNPGESNQIDFAPEAAYDEPPPTSETATNNVDKAAVYDFPSVSAAADDVVAVEEPDASASRRYYSNSYQPDVSPSPDASDFIPKPQADFVPNSVGSDRSEGEYFPVSGENASAEEKVFTAETNGELHVKPLTQADPLACPYCRELNESQAVVCHSCRVMLTLSDLEALLAHRAANAEFLQVAIDNMEAEKAARALNVEGLTNLAVAYLNANDLQKGLACLREASQMSPNNVVLSAKVNFLAIRLAEIEAHDSKSPDAPAKCRTIMIVDDSPTVRKLISGKLEKCGHTVVCAVDGMDALSKISEAVPDLILLDINMPRMDGYQVCKLIRGNELTKEVPVVMISGKDGFFDKVRGRMAGSSGYITKPFGPDTLMRTLESYIN